MMAKGSRTKKIIAVSVAVLVVLIAAGGGVFWWYENVKLPHDQAIEQYESLSQEYAAVNQELEDQISSLQEIVDAGEKVYDESVITDAQLAISDAKDAVVCLPDCPEQTEEILNLLSTYAPVPDYGTQVSALTNAKTDYENSVKQMGQITNPTESFVVERLNGLANVDQIQAVTEDNDPNGKLGKAGGYTAAVYFTSDLVDPEDVYNDGENGFGPVGQGTDGGGCIEVYVNEDDAKKRDDYLATFDGSALDVGSHKVLGTMVIRVSDQLKASQQKEIEEAIEASFVELR